MGDVATRVELLIYFVGSYSDLPRHDGSSQGDAASLAEILHRGSHDAMLGYLKKGLAAHLCDQARVDAPRRQEPPLPPSCAYCLRAAARRLMMITSRLQEAKRPAAPPSSFQLFHIAAAWPCPFVQF